MLKKHKVVMLPTEKATGIVFFKDKLQYSITSKIRSNKEGQHLYILGTKEDKIEEGTIIIHNSNEIGKVIAITEFHYIVKFDRIEVTCQKYNCLPIIASTDESLRVAKVSEGFIKKFIEKYNTGTPITDVMVEYEELSARLRIDEPKLSLKLDSHNTITIKPVNDTFSKGEMLRFAMSFANHCLLEAGTNLNSAGEMVKYEKNYFEQNF